MYKQKLIVKLTYVKHDSIFCVVWHVSWNNSKHTWNANIEENIVIYDDALNIFGIKWAKIHYKICSILMYRPKVRDKIENGITLFL